jgi:RNA polymerase sigma-B factor
VNAQPSGEPTGLTFYQRAGTDILVRRCRDDHDHAARDELFARYAPLARRLAGRYHRNRYEPLEDLVQVASVGLLAAIDRFDPDRGMPFEAFAIPTILGELKRHFRNTGWSVHVPRGAQELALRIDTAVQQITSQTGRQPHVHELAKYLAVNPEEVLAGLETATAHYAVSLDAPVARADGEQVETLGDGIGVTDDGYRLIETAAGLSAAAKHLPYLERRALALRLGHNLKQSEIAQELDCSQMQVSRLLRRAGARLRELTDPSVQHLRG